MDTHQQTRRFTVEVSGSWLDPVTRAEEPRTETFNVTAGHKAAAEIAGVQLYSTAAAAQRFRAGDCTAKAG